MSELTPDTQGAQPAESATVETQGAQPAVDSSALEAELENLDAAGLARALGFDADDAGTPETDTEDQPATPPAEESSEQDPDAESETDAQDPPEEEAKHTVNRRRLSVTGLPDQDRELTAAAIAMVREGKAATIVDAIHALTGASQATQPSEAEAANTQPEPQAPPPPTLLELEARFEQASEELADAIRDFDQEKQIELNKEIALLNRKILKAEQVEETRMEQAQSWEQTYQAAVNEMETKYADLLDDDSSPFADWLDDKVAAAQARRDPAINDPRFIVAFADEIAARVSKTAAPGKAPAPVPPRPASTVGTSVAPAHKAKPQISTRQAEEFIEKADSATLAKALWG
jgi:hypothetical protein